MLEMYSKQGPNCRGRKQRHSPRAIISKLFAKSSNMFVTNDVVILGFSVHGPRQSPVCAEVIANEQDVVDREKGGYSEGPGRLGTDLHSGGADPDKLGVFGSIVNVTVG